MWYPQFCELGSSEQYLLKCLFAVPLINLFFHSKYFLIVPLSLYVSEEHEELAMAGNALGVNEFCTCLHGVSCGCLPITC
jgi:hypothetical protein